MNDFHFQEEFEKPRSPNMAAAELKRSIVRLSNQKKLELVLSCLGSFTPEKNLLSESLEQEKANADSVIKSRARNDRQESLRSFFS